jgi:5'(3')-deoxyribonucleotidase
MSIHHPSLDILFPSLLGESPFPDGKIPHVFCDVDGVLANFYEGMQRDFGVAPAQVNNFLVNKNGWAIIAKKKPHLFATLPLLPDAKGLIAGLVKLRDKKQIKLSILTAIPDEWYRDPVMRKVSTQDKINWITRFFQNVPAKNVLVVRREDKQKYAKAQRAIGSPAPVLIDDFPKNIREWEMAGGLGIHHTSSMSSLHQLLNYLN